MNMADSYEVVSGPQCRKGSTSRMVSHCVLRSRPRNDVGEDKSLKPAVTTSLQGKQRATRVKAKTKNTKIWEETDEF